MITESINFYEKLKEAFKNENQVKTLVEFMDFAIQQPIRLELKEIRENMEYWLGELSRAQAKTEQRLNELTERVDKLAEAQIKTEQRLNELAIAQAKTEQRLNELTERVDRLTERVDKLTERVDKLAEAQIKTEQRLNELAIAQAKTEQRLNELTERVDRLAEAQSKTEQELKKLVHEHQETRKQLGGISSNLGFHLENLSYKHLPFLLKRDFDIEVKGKLIRDFLQDKNGRDIQINILGKGVRNGKEILIVGESKIELSKKYVDEFIRKKINIIDVKYEIFPILITHMTSSPDVKKYAKEKGIAVYLSYEFE
ncbi:MAG: hypothetical protein ACP5QT_06850 [Brevinematia bacterium]